MIAIASGNSPASDFIATLLHGATIAHMHHFTVTGPGSLAKHEALGELYDGLTDKADGLAEAFMGCTGQALAFGASSIIPGKDPVADVQRLYEFVEAKRGAMGTESHIQNIVDEVCTVIASALYKLRRLA